MMKQISMLTIGALIICMGASTNLLAQNQLKISGNGSKGSILTATVNGAAVEKIEWKLNGETLVTAGSSRQGVTVAGGKCNGSGANQLNQPNGVFVDGADNIWVADTRNGRVQKFTPGNLNGITIGGDLPNHPTFPVNIFVRPNGDVYVADYFEGKVKLLVKDGTEWVNVAGQNGELDLVRGVWVDNSGNVFCTQYGFYFNGTVKLDGMILKYPPNSSAWEIVAGGNGAGSALNQFSAPTSVMLDAAGNIYVADADNDHGMKNSRIMKWAPGATEGVIVAGGNGDGENPNQCPSPGHAYVNPKGNVYVSHYVANKITMWNLAGTKGVTVAGGNGLGNAADQFSSPLGIFLKGKFLYVVDLYNDRVQRFDLSTPNTTQTLTARYPGNYTAVATFEDGSVVESNSVSISASRKPITTPASKTLKTNKAVAYPNPANNSVTVNYTAEKSSQFIF